MLPSPPPGTADSGVNAEYHCATLVNGWEEERKTFGQCAPHAQTGALLETETTTHTAHKAYSPAEMIAARPSSYYTSETPRELLYHHGSIAAACTVDQASVSELSYTDPRHHHSYHTDEVLDMSTISQRQEVTRARKTGALQCGQALRCGADVLPSHAASCGNSCHWQCSGCTGNGTHPSDCIGLHTSVAIVDGEVAHSEPHHHACSGTNAEGPSACHSRNDNLSQEAIFLGSLSRAHTHTGAAAANPSRADTYTPPCLPPVGRAAERERFVTTKQTTIDATAHYIREHPKEVYPLTSSTCAAGLTKSLDNPMRRTKLREEYEPETDRCCHDK